eukprot:408929_1
MTSVVRTLQFGRFGPVCLASTCSVSRVFATQKYFQTGWVGAYNDWTRLRCAYDGSMTIYDWPKNYLNHPEYKTTISGDECEYMMAHEAYQSSDASQATQPNIANEDYYDEVEKPKYPFWSNMIQQFKSLYAEDFAEDMMIYDWPHGYLKQSEETSQPKACFGEHYHQDMAMYDWPDGYWKPSV